MAEIARRILNGLRTLRQSRSGTIVIGQRGSPEVTQSEFMNLHANCVNALGVYVVQAKKTTQLLSECTDRPPSAEQRIDIVSQGIAESDAHLNYLGAKSIFCNAALAGYGFSN